MKVVQFDIVENGVKHWYIRLWRSFLWTFWQKWQRHDGFIYAKPNGHLTFSSKGLRGANLPIGKVIADKGNGNFVVELGSDNA